MKGLGIETKVIAAAAGGGAGAALSTFLLWLLGVTVWGVSDTAAHAADAIAAVPVPVSSLIAVIITVGLTAVAGYAAPHTARVTLTQSQSQPGNLQSGVQTDSGRPMQSG